MSELLKAVTMFAPMVLLAALYEDGWAPAKSVVALGTAAVFVPSFSYHSLCYLRQFEDIIDNKARRLDQSGQHVANVLFAYALSGSPLYVSLVAGYSASAIALLWCRGEHDTPFYRRANLLVTIALALAPMARRKDYKNLAGAAATLAFMLPLFMRGGHCHSLSHVLLGPYIYFIFKSADTV